MLDPKTPLPALCKSSDEVMLIYAIKDNRAYSIDPLDMSIENQDTNPGFYSLTTLEFIATIPQIKEAFPEAFI